MTATGSGTCWDRCTCCSATSTEHWRHSTGIYLVPLVLGHEPRRLDIWHGSNWEWLEYAVEVPQELLNLWDDVALQWAQEISEHPPVAAKVVRYVEIHRELKAEPRGPRRTALVRE